MILTQNDIIERYAKKRKNLPEADVRDLLRCVLKFIKEDREEYAYHIPSIGTLYKKMESVREGSEEYHKMFLETVFYQGVHPLKRKDETLEHFKEQI
jgi:hypothetical protein